MPGGGETGSRARSGLAMVLALAAALLLPGCFGGGGTETETVGVLWNTDGSPAVKALVRFRPVDYLADSLPKRQDAPDWETETDGRGRFIMRNLAPGAYRMHADGGNGRGLVEDIYLEREDQRLELDPDTLRPHGAIAGRIVLDTTADLRLHVQVFGMEAHDLVDQADGSFMIDDLPPGEYKLRFLGIGPYRRQAISDSQKVLSGTVTRIDSVVLNETAKLTYSDYADSLVIDGLGPRSPVIFDNEFWDNGPDNEYVWAKASAGDLDLRGNVVTDAMGKDKSTLEAQLAKAAVERSTALLAGLEGIPAPVAGASLPLVSSSGPLEEIKAYASAGSDLIVAEARKCSPDTPLVVVVGGPLTTVANAYLTDNTIASRMIVIAVYPFSINSADAVSTYVVAKRCRLVVWGRDYLWKGSPDPAGIAALPGSRMGERLKSFFTANARTGVSSLGDLAPVAHLFDRRVWTGTDMKRFAPPLSVQPASVLVFDFLDILEEHNDWGAYPREFFAAFANPAAFAPAALPGQVEAEGYSARSGARGALTAAGSAPDTSLGDAMAGSEGAWLEFPVAGDSSRTYAASVRVRSPAGGRISIGTRGQPAGTEFTVPAGGDWMAVDGDVILAAGTQALRLDWIAGSVEVDWMRFERK